MFFIKKVKKEKRYDLDYMLEVYKNYNGVLTIHSGLTNTTDGSIAYNNSFDGNTITISNQNYHGYKSDYRKSLVINIQAFIRENFKVCDIANDLVLNELSEKFISLISDFISDKNENYSIILSNQDYFLDEDLKLYKINTHLLNKFQDFMKPLIESGSKKFLINQWINEKNPFFKLSNESKILFLSTKNSFLNVNFDFKYVSESIYSICKLNNYIISIINHINNPNNLNMHYIHLTEGLARKPIALAVG